MIGSTELQLTLPVPTKPGAVGPRNSTMFRKLAVQRIGLERNITVHSVLGLSGMNLLGQLHADSQDRSRPDGVSPKG